jgi:hypothetical protein
MPFLNHEDVFNLNYVTSEKYVWSCIEHEGVLFPVADAYDHWAAVLLRPGRDLQMFCSNMDHFQQLSFPKTHIRPRPPTKRIFSLYRNTQIFTAPTLFPFIFAPIVYLALLVKFYSCHFSSKFFFFSPKMTWGDTSFPSRGGGGGGQ